VLAGGGGPVLTSRGRSRFHLKMLKDNQGRLVSLNLSANMVREARRTSLLDAGPALESPSSAFKQDYRGKDTDQYQDPHAE
jgi:hypothetical protein